MSIPMEQMYRQRKEFMIVALTGIAGSGCSDLADTMSKPFAEWKRKVRPTEGIEHLRTGNKRQMVFQREYDLCYHVCEKQYAPFVTIKYRNVLLLCALEALAGECKDVAQLRDAFAGLVRQKFDKGHGIEADVRDEAYVVDNNITAATLVGCGMTDDLWLNISSVAGVDQVNNKRAYRKELYKLFESAAFTGFCEQLYDELKRRDYYAKNFFTHRLATSLRATGRPEVVVQHDNKEKDNDHVFVVAEKINVLIKGYHEVYPERDRRFVIDAVRNSMEVLYLRERYNAFYMIAMHNDGSEAVLLREKVCRSAYGKGWEDASNEEQEKAMKQVARIMSLSEEESKMDDFEDGMFFGPDISRCVTESEIHIAHHEVNELERMDQKAREENEQMFYSTAEQWMKFYSLIIRPGLITPSRDERCMSVAYVAKFNSGCISRQVGCTIVDEESAIQSVGWNDPPSEQLPCQLRYADEMCKCGSEGYRYVPQLGSRLFSEFELHGYVKRKDGAKPFTEHFMEDINEGTLSALKEQGLRYPYCFRARYNKYKGEKDAVNTRSLHAEENTMLRLARCGGQGLKGGTMYVTASPCVLCSKKAYQIGIKEIVYLDPYTDIAPDLILACGFNQPKLRPFMGAIGETFYKLYKPFLPYKDELAIWDRGVKKEKK